MSAQLLLFTILSVLVLTPSFRVECVEVIKIYVLYCVKCKNSAGGLLYRTVVARIGDLPWNAFDVGISMLYSLG